MSKEELLKILSTQSVLFVDDEKFVIEQMGEILPMIFDKVYFALNGKDGIMEFKKNQIDIIITDISMPQLDGISMIQEIKKTVPKIKTIFISGHNEQHYLESTNKLKGEYIVKPLSYKALYNALYSLYV